MPGLQLPSTPCPCPGKTPFQVENRTLWRNIFTFSILCRAQASRWPSLTCSPQSAHLSACIHPETPSPFQAASLHSLLQGLDKNHTKTHLAGAQQPTLVSLDALTQWHPCSSRGICHGPVGLAEFAAEPSHRKGECSHRALPTACLPGVGVPLQNHSRREGLQKEQMPCAGSV